MVIIPTVLSPCLCQEEFRQFKHSGAKHYHCRTKGMAHYVGISFRYFVVPAVIRQHSCGIVAVHILLTPSGSFPACMAVMWRRALLATDCNLHVYFVAGCNSTILENDPNAGESCIVRFLSKS